MTRVARGIVVWIALLVALAPVCHADTARELAGERKGGFFHPKFQRWRIVKVAPVPLMNVPEDAGGIPTILRGRYLYLSDGYITIPDLNSDGDRVMGACFTLTRAALQVQPAFKGDGGPDAGLLLRSAPGDRLLLTFGRMFELTLEQSKITDGGYQQRRLATSFNAILASQSGSEKTPCDVQPVKLTPPRPAGDLELYVPASGGKVTMDGADMDAELIDTLRITDVSQQWRSKLNPADPANTVSGCAGELFVTQLMHARRPDAGSVGTESFLVGIVVGRVDATEACERVAFLRRIDAGKLLELLDIPAPPSQTVSLSLQKWIGDGVFLAKVGMAEVELSVSREPRILVKLVQ